MRETNDYQKRLNARVDAIYIHQSNNSTEFIIVSIIVTTVTAFQT